MLKLPIQEGIAFDMLAILLVKSKKLPNIANTQNYHFLADQIKNQIGVDSMQKILNSPEFKEMVDVNQKTFEAVDMVKNDSIPGSVIDKLNYSRYLAKVNLQKTYFDSELSEQKLGY